jgi:hypothetical protein
LQHAAQQIANGEPRPGVVDLVDIINEESGAAAAAQFVKQFIAADRAADDASHLKPATADDAAGRQHKNGAFVALLRRKRLEYAGFADARCTDDLHHLRLIQRLTSVVNQSGADSRAPPMLSLMSARACSADSERRACTARRSGLPPKRRPCFCAIVSALPIDLAARSAVRQRFVGQNRPKIGRAVSLIGRENRPAPFPHSMIVIRSRRLKVKDKNLESAQEVPDRLVI